MYATTPEANDHLRRGQIALAHVETWGVRVDPTYLDATRNDMLMRIHDIEHRMESSKFFRRWKKTFDEKTKMGSRQQLEHLLFKVLGHESVGQTATGRERTDKAALETIDVPFVKDFLAVEELKKAKSTYLDGIAKEMVCQDGMWFVHPSYNLNLAQTLRSSCSNPNFQNQPVRNPELAEIIRRCYIPRPKCHFGEPDLSQIEVRIAACYNKDPNLIKYIQDKSTDMHRDCACDIFKLIPGDVGKETRHAAKNQFVFPQFYGSVYFQCAPALWDAIARRKLKRADGESVKKHLAYHGITELGDCDPKANPGPHTFVAHLKEVERAFWARFKVYDQWKRDWYQKYLETGGWQTLFGFGMGGFHKKNDVINYPVQCDAFHVNLWAIVRIVAWLRKYKMQTRVVGQIHDSIQIDVHKSELQDVLNYMHEWMTERPRKAFPWIIVPLESESDLAPLEKSWHEKKEWVRNGSGIWGPKA